MESLLEKIRVPSKADPNRPEFPPRHPCFPATPTLQIKVPGFQNVWLKDESVNPYSGTHKDRLAWEVVVLYRDLLRAQRQGRLPGKLPQFSTISSGSTAVATGRMLREYDLPKLKVLVGQNLHPSIYQAICESHCEIFVADLEREELGPGKILSLTKNDDGFDLTSNRGISLDIGNFDWMCHEILNESPEVIFLPFGSGFVFTKLLEVMKDCITSPYSDKRYTGNLSSLSACSVIGATTHFPGSIADKLYSPFLPFARINDEWIRFYKTAAYCGTYTGIHEVQEAFFIESMRIAQSQNIVCEPSGIAGLALLLQMGSSLFSDKKILIVNTGKLRLTEESHPRPSALHSDSVL